MAIRRILKDGDPTLRKKSRGVEDIDKRVCTLLDDMRETMYAADGMGLAAPQVGILRRIVVVDTGEGLLELINPQFVTCEGSVVDAEACLSIPGMRGTVDRPEHVVLRAQNRKGEWKEYDAHGVTARCFCHELDHLEGKLFTDVMIKRLPEEDD